MFLSKIKIKNHPILNDLDLDFINPKTKKPYAIIAFVGENACGKTTLLNEMFAYNESEYIVEKETTDVGDLYQFNMLYLRQGVLHKNGYGELEKLIAGETAYSNNNYGLKNGMWISEHIDGVLNAIRPLNNKTINHLAKESKISKIHCSSDITKLISGRKYPDDISNHSSGEQDIILRLNDLNNLSDNTDCILFDEPETSLHPRWQKEIIGVIEQILKANKNTPQTIMATHSEKILESIVNRDDVLIIRLFNDNGIIHKQTITEMDLRLPTSTFAELDYVVFGIDSLEYNDLLLAELMRLKKVKSFKAIDEFIENHHLFVNQTHSKISKYKVWNKWVECHTLPVYIRHYFHHPNDYKAPSRDELKASIVLLREVLKK